MKLKLKCYFLLIEVFLAVFKRFNLFPKLFSLFFCFGNLFFCFGKLQSHLILDGFLKDFDVVFDSGVKKHFNFSLNSHTTLFNSI